MSGANAKIDETLPREILSQSSAESRTAPGVLYAGMLLDGRYLIERELGRGGISVVYLAHDQQLLSKPVVIKVLLEQSEDLDLDGWSRQKFEQEIEALARIDHPGVVGVFDAGKLPNGKPYFVMQFVEGVTLRSVISAQGMDLARVERIIRQISHALGAAHEKGVIHRDLKPANIMLQRLGEKEEYVKLIDFGIATVKDSHVRPSGETSRVAGTILYMAPEQLMGKPSLASDIYALGVITYEMITGRQPFNPDSPFELLELQRAGVKVKPTMLRPDLPSKAQEVILKALSFHPDNRYASAQEFGESLARALTLDKTDFTRPRHLDRESVDDVTVDLNAKRVVILYKRNAQPDAQVSKLLEAELVSRGYNVFIDRHLSIGVEWAREIEQQLRSADAVITLLSESSITSEMLAYEIQTAHDAAQQSNGKPYLLPIRICYEGSLPKPLAAILDPIHYVLWEGSDDNQSLVAELLGSLRNSSPPRFSVTRRSLEPVGGAVPLDSKFYIVRPTDDEFHAAISRGDGIVLVKGARQMGKTSLLARGLQRARETGVKVVLTDFQSLNSSHLESVDTLFLTLANEVAEQLDLDVYPRDVWQPERGPSINFGRYIRREVLGKIGSRLVWGLDEIDRLFSCAFGSEVFGLFRSWHNARSLDPEGQWHKLTLAIAYATEAHLFMTDLNQSPFNVGTRLVLEDFTLDQLAELNRRYGSPLREAAEVTRYFGLVGGQPYLVRKGLHEMATHNTGLSEFRSHAASDEGPFGDHLRRILVLLAHDTVLCDAVRGVLQGHSPPTDESFYRLRSAGVMAGDSPREARPRCQLYATYLAGHLS